MSKAPDGTAYDLTGPEGAPVVVLIHGLGLSRALWTDFVPALSGYRVLTYDLYGHGHSAPAPEQANLTLFARQLHNLLHHLCIDCASLVGFSIGGMINRRFAMDFPEMVTSLAIWNSPHDRGEEAQKIVEDRAASVRNQGAFSTFDAALARWFTPDYLASGAGPALVRDWREQVDAESYAQTAWVLAHGVRELTGRHGKITVPTQVITCENDSGSTPAMSHDIAAEIPGSSVAIIPSLQHLGLMEEPQAFLAPLHQFLEINA